MNTACGIQFTAFGRAPTDPPDPQRICPACEPAAVQVGGGVIAVEQRRDPIPIAGRLDGQAHDVTTENVVVGQGTGGHETIPQGYLVSAPVPGPPSISADAAARALREYFMANADRGDHAANDDLVAETVHRIRARQASPEGEC